MKKSGSVNIFNIGFIVRFISHNIIHHKIYVFQANMELYAISQFAIKTPVLSGKASKKYAMINNIIAFNIMEKKIFIIVF